MPQNGPIQGLQKLNKVVGSSTKKQKANFSNTYGIKPSKVKGKSAITSRVSKGK